MARQFLTGLNLNKNELLNARIQNLALPPASPVAGQIYYNTGDNTLRYYNGTAWLTLAQGGSVEQAITNAINALTTDDIEEGNSNLYYTEARAKGDAAELLTGATLTNITITGNGSGLVITAENGVADSTTDDLEEGTTNLYFTTERAQDAVGNAVTDGLEYDDASGAISLKYNPNAGAISVNESGNVFVKTDGTTIDTAGSGNYLRVLTGPDSPVASKEYATSEASTAVTNHNNSTSGVHGVTGNVVGDTDAQTLTNKDLGTGTSLSANIDANGNTITDLGTPISDSDAATKLYVDTEVSDHSDLSSNVHGVGSGDVVGTLSSQTLTNKVLGDNTSLGADLDADNYRITGLATPQDPNDAATKAYVDSVAEGLHVQASVVVASTGNVDISAGNAPSAIDGVTLTDQMRVLLKNQTDAAQNGIYVYDQGTDTLIRAVDYNTAAEVDAGDFVFVDRGDTYANTGWVQTNTIGILDFDPIAWVQFSGAGTFTAGDGLTLDGTEFNVVGTADRITVNADSVDIAATYVGQTSITTLGTISTGTWEAGTIDVERGGTGATTAAGARANLGATTKYATANPELVPSSGIVTWAVTHNLGTRRVLVQVYDTEFFDEVEVDVERTNTNTVTLKWVAGATVAADKYEVVIVG